MDRQWITIRGRRILCKAFIYTLDRYRYAEAIERRGNKVFDNFCRMICALQDATSEYVNGKDSIEDGLVYTFDLYHMELPTERKLPEALEELLEQIESKLDINLTDMLDQCMKNSELFCQQSKERLASQTIKKENPEDQIKKLLSLQKAKSDLSEEEIKVTKVWCDVLITSIFSKAISYGLMLGLVENELLDESEISDLLENKYGIKKDYEWYSEDFLGSELGVPTDIRVEDVFRLCAKRVEKIIGTTL